MPRQGILVCAIAPLAGASPRPPMMPSSTKGTKRCRNALRLGATFRIYLVRGRHRISCAKARGLVWMRNDRRVIVGGIVLA